MNRKELVSWYVALAALAFLSAFGLNLLFHRVANVSVYVITYYNSLPNMSQAVSVGMMAVFFAGALPCMWYIRKNVIVYGRCECASFVLLLTLLMDMLM